MAANLQRRGLVSVGKRFVEANRTALPRDPTPFSASWRGVHLSTYDKNVEEEVRPSMVPDSAIDPELDKYWAPNPKTGVFGPADDSGGGGGGEELAPPAAGSVLEEKAWFRPSEDVEKPPPPLTLE